MSSPQLDLAKDPVPAPIHELITFFAAELADTRFPDVDAEALAELAGVVRARAHDVARARQVLEEVLTGLEESRSALEVKAQRALAYARVFAQGQESLSRRLEELELAARPRGRRAAPTEPVAAAEERPVKRRKRRNGADAPPAPPLLTSAVERRETAAERGEAAADDVDAREDEGEEARAA